MNDSEIITELAKAGRCSDAVRVAHRLEELVGSLSQSLIVSYFKQAFPEIPLRTLLEASGWNAVCQGGIADEEFSAMLGAWLPKENEESGASEK